MLPVRHLRFLRGVPHQGHVDTGDAGVVGRKREQMAMIASYKVDSVAPEPIGVVRTSDVLLDVGFV